MSRDRQHRAWLNIRRAFYEWGTLFCGATAAAGLIWWIVSITGNLADFEPFSLQDPGVASVSGGSIRLNSSRHTTFHTLEMYANSGWPAPSIDSDRELTIPGFRCHILHFARSDTYEWAFEMSILVPFLVPGFLAALCAHRYRAIRRRLIAETSRLESTTTRLA